jgi:hypothetical protein
MIHKSIIISECCLTQMGDYYGSSSAAAAAAVTADPPQQSPPPPQSQPPRSGISLQHSDATKIFVGGLEESLRWHFEQYGTVVSVEVMRDRHTGGTWYFLFLLL